jgi:PTH1 family peptidyl-tRNA hydrolase
VAARVIVGLGNPGKKYTYTRHNLGYLAVQAWARLEGWAFKEEKRFHAHVTKGNQGDTSVALLLPDTYMNESGRAVRAYLDYYGVSPQHLVVVSDDIHIDYGVLRLRPEGSAGGHNGLKSIETHLGTSAYPRLRMGIGRAGPEKPLVEHVLDLFSPEEIMALPAFLERAVTALKQIVTTADLTQVMGSVNGKSKGEQKA